MIHILDLYWIHLRFIIFLFTYELPVKLSANNSFKDINDQKRFFAHVFIKKSLAHGSAPISNEELTSDSRAGSTMRLWQIFHSDLAVFLYLAFFVHFVI